LYSQRQVNAAAFLLEIGRGDKVAIEEGERTITYAELREQVARSAGAWQALGVAPDDRVLVLAADSIDWVVAYLGAIWAGGAAVGLNSRLFERELSTILAESGARYVWCDTDGAALLAACADPETPGPEPMPASDFAPLLTGARPAAPVERTEEDMAFWIYTSGTTGAPKAAIHPQRSVLASTDFVTEVLGGGADDKLYATSKLFFAYAHANALCAGLRLGATLVLDREWATAERAAELVARHRPTILFTVPTLYLKLLQAGVTPQLRGVRHFVSAGEKLPVALRRSWREATGVLPLDCYGTSETDFLMLWSRDEQGRFSPTPRVELRPRDPGGSKRSPQRIWLRHPSVALGYWRRPDADADAFEGGWFSPGDLFRFHGASDVEICGRVDDLLKISGQWVSIHDVEQALVAGCGGEVAELGAVAFESEHGLASIAVFAVAAPGRERQAERLLQASIDALPKLKRPRAVRWTNELPRTATGKLQRNKLRELLHEPARAVGPR
jgi:acyl-coenzyme A synthetase/AMP-(fatty) acid ligase